MADLNENLNHVSEALGNLVEQFKDKENLADFITPFVQQVQDAEAAAFELINERTIEAAVGVQLDGIGSIVGVARGGLNDDDYRLRIQAQIKINLSSGTMEELITILDLLIANSFEIRDFYPAGLVVTVADELAEDPELIARTVKRARPAGVDASFEYTLTDDSATFTFASGDTAEASAAQGFGNDAGTTGGKFSDAEEM